MSNNKVFGAVTPTILLLSKDPTDFYIGRPLWFSVTFVYISVVYIVQMTWLDLAKDFQCHGNISKSCVAECYESHFTKPVLGVWYLVGFAFSSVFFVMEFFVSQSVHKQIKMLKKQPLKENSSDTDKKADHVKIKEDEIFYLSKEKHLLAMYLVYFFVQLSIQVIFLVILIHCHLPLIKKSIWCSTHLCHGPYTCVVMGTQEKIMSIILLATVSVVIMTFCLMFFVYTINAYVTLSKTYRVCIKF
ncbi:uncharacterized protein LOC116661262 [Camelus ferus]|uniref:Uncharacterized protein LOC116661262 n=1 Tax=Camelus ferus TaxID=419612 RepID=A0A8B8SEX5_CAMFR|nr:uncharacterized protein LOC116150314 [Camelus dromedarius]XP_032328793.1 uncharacterized protein LOC116661262 [Camelus ferus]